MLIFGYHHDGHCLSCVFMVVYNNTAYLVKTDVQADHQLFCQLRTHGKKLFLTFSVLDWLKAQLEECSIYEIAQNRLQCRRVFCCFYGVEKGCIGNKWGKFPLTKDFSKICFLFRFSLKKAMYVQKSFLEKRNRYLSASQSLLQVVPYFEFLWFCRCHALLMLFQIYKPDQGNAAFAFITRYKKPHSPFNLLEDKFGSQSKV